MVTLITFTLAALCAALMGFAIQRGATCTVAAVDELLRQRRATRLLALLEASAWVAGGLLVAQGLGWLQRAPTGYALSGWTVLGAALLGLGAYVNRACVFGAIARLGSGEWAYLATPLGFYLGCVSVSLFGMPDTPPLPARSSVLNAPDWVAALVIVAAGLRVGWPLLIVPGHTSRQTLAARLWAPHTATIVIGITFLVMLLVLGSWAYTDVLAELAHGMAHSLAVRTALLVCLLLGAIVGGWTAGRLRQVRPQASAVLRCAAGGALMGWGSLLIPGGNDGLILVGMPLMWPYAWVAFGTMCVAIGGAQWLAGRRWARAVSLV